jgi:serine/threonine protein kinase
MVHAHEGPAAAEVVADRYELKSEIGHGGMATVYRAWDRRLGRDVAIKLLAPALAADPVVRRRFEAEANVAACVSHPNVVTIFDTNERDGHPFIAMECLSGETLARELSVGPLPAERVRRVALDVLGGLGAAHAFGVIHRDIKPSNLLIGDDGKIKIADFGIAKSVDSADHTATGNVMGSVAYIAPERLRGQSATVESDLYSLGVVLYECVAGAKPFSGDAPATVAHAIATTSPRPIRTVRADVDDDLATVIDRALAKHPGERYASAAEMAAALLVGPDPDRTVIATVAGRLDEPTARSPTVSSTLESTRAHAPPREPNPARPKRSAVRATAAATAIAAIIVIALVAIGFVRSTPNPAIHAPSSPTASSIPPAGQSSQTTLPAKLGQDLRQLDQAVRP